MTIDSIGIHSNAYTRHVRSLWLVLVAAMHYPRERRDKTIVMGPSALLHSGKLALRKKKKKKKIGIKVVST